MDPHETLTQFGRGSRIDMLVRVVFYVRLVTHVEIQDRAIVVVLNFLLSFFLFLFPSCFCFFVRFAPAA